MPYSLQNGVLEQTGKYKPTKSMISTIEVDEESITNRREPLVEAMARKES